MKRMIIHALTTLLLLGASGYVGAEATPPRTASVMELYQHNSSGDLIPFLLERKIAVRFMETADTRMSAEAKEEYLKSIDPKWLPVAIEQVKQVYPKADYVITYLPTTDLKSMEALISKMLADPLLEVAPVVRVDGRSAVVDGIYIEPTARIARANVEAGLRSAFGSDAMIHEITPVASEDGAELWHVSFKKLFYLGEKSLPLHALLVANILDRRNTQPVWVKRAYPKFAFLQEPVIATVRVLPVSGTVGEPRTVELSITIFGKTKTEVEVKPEDIPVFHDRKFMVNAGNPPAPPVAGFMRNESAPPEKGSRVEVAPNTWRITHRYYFDLYAPEPEWTISGVEVPYWHKGKRAVAKAPDTTFFVRPHLTEANRLQDIPAPFVFPEGKILDVKPTLAPPPHRFYDGMAKVLGGASNLALLASATSLLALMFVLMQAARWLRKRDAQMHAQELPAVVRRVDFASALQRARELAPMGALREMHTELSKLIAQCFPGAQSSQVRVTFQEWKTIASLPEFTSVCGAVERGFVESVFADLDAGLRPEFQSAPSEELGELVASLEERLLSLYDLLTQGRVNSQTVEVDGGFKPLDPRFA